MSPLEQIQYLEDRRFELYADLLEETDQERREQLTHQLLTVDKDIDNGNYILGAPMKSPLFKGRFLYSFFPLYLVEVDDSFWVKCVATIICSLFLGFLLGWLYGTRNRGGKL